jgi:hypothetical protein
MIYLHRITDNRISGSLLKNLRMFTNLCGQEATSNVVIATTMWSEAKQESGARREAELMNGFWKDLLDAGCKVERFLDTYDSAWDVIDCHERDRARVQLPHEIVERDLTLERTSAGITLHNDLKKLLRDRRAAARKLRTQMKSQDNDLVVQQLNEQQAEITQTANQIRELIVRFLAFLFKNN